MCTIGDEQKAWEANYLRTVKRLAEGGQELLDALEAIPPGELVEHLRAYETSRRFFIEEHPGLKSDSKCWQINENDGSEYGRLVAEFYDEDEARRYCGWREEPADA